MNYCSEMCLLFNFTFFLVERIAFDTKKYISKMLGLYYKIWVDCIVRMKQQPENKQNWRTKTMIFMTLSMSANFILVMTILEKHVFRNYFYKIDFSFLPTRLNNLLAYLFLFILPCITLNYLLIFRNKRYENLIKKYKYHNGKIFVIYFSISLLLPIAILWFGIIFLS